MMNKFWVILLLPLLSLTNIGCHTGSSSTTRKDETIPNGGNPTYVVVLCDLSKSVNSDGSQDKIGYTNCLQNIKNACTQILSAEPPNSHIVFYTVSESATNQPFFIFDVDETNQRNALEVEELHDSCKKRIGTIIDSLSKNPETTSCILGSIERTNNIFSKTDGRQGYNKKLIILSDLLEDCSYSVAGSVHIKNDKTLTESDKAGLRTIYNYKSNVNFEKDHVSLTIYITSPQMPDPVLRCVDTSWAKPLFNMGFKNLHTPIYNSLVDIKPWGED